jgi:hypothetical protein
LTRPQSGDNKQAKIKMLNRSGRITGLLIALVFLGAAGELRLSSGIEQRIDLRSSAAARQDEAANARRAAGRLLQAAERFGTGLRSWFSETGRLRSLQRHSPPLSAPDRRDPETIGRSFAQAHADLLDVQEVWIQNLELVARDKAGPNTLLRFRQQWQGVPVFQSDLRIHITPAGEVTELDIRLEHLPAPSGLTDPVRFSAPAALLRSMEGLTPDLRSPRLEIRETAAGPRRRTRMHFAAQGDDVTAQLVWFPVSGKSQPAWHFDAVSTDGQTYYECVVDAGDGALLYRNSITDSEISGLVFDTASPQPTQTPGMLPPEPNPPNLVPRTLVSFSGDPAASPAGWVGPEKETIGNNVIAREDKAGDNETTWGAAARAIDDSFLFGLELGPGALSPVNFTEAAITNLFFWCNLAHDYFYHLGSTEEAGNFQEDNFGKGGLGGDSLRADAQDALSAIHPT